MSQITRANVEALIPKEVIPGIVEGVIKNSKVLSLFRRLPNMTTNKSEMKVLDLLPVAYWQTSDTATKKLTNTAWANKYIYAEEIAVIVPIAENVLNDAEYDIWGQIRPRLQEAFGRKIDEAVIVGIDKPAKFRADLLTSIRNADKNVTPTADLYADIAGEDGLMAQVEASGFNPTAILGGPAIKAKFRMLTDTTGQLLVGTVLGDMRKEYVDNGTWDADKAQMVVGDFSQAVYAIRQDLTFKILDQAVIQDPSTGEILYNLAQNDMVALRCVMRLGWEIPNPINTLDQTETRFPFALLEAAVAATTYVLTVNVKDGAQSPANVAGAKVTVGGISKKTNSSGNATFTVNGSTDYIYGIEKAGVDPQYGTVSIASAAKTLSIVNFG